MALAQISRVPFSSTVTWFRVLVVSPSIPSLPVSVPLLTIVPFSWSAPLAPSKVPPLTVAFCRVMDFPPVTMVPVFSIVLPSNVRFPACVVMVPALVRLA